MFLLIGIWIAVGFGLGIITALVIALTQTRVVDDFNKQALGTMRECLNNNVNPRYKTPHQCSVEVLMRGIGKVIPDRPILLNGVDDHLKTQLLLHLEEVWELAEACGIEIWLACSDDDSLEVFFRDLTLRQTGEPDIVEIADAAADIMVVATGAMSLCGIADNTILQEVDQNNKLKIQGGHIDKETGKFIKPVNHPKPSIKQRLIEQGLVVNQVS